MITSRSFGPGSQGLVLETSTLVQIGRGSQVDGVASKHAWDAISVRSNILIRVGTLLAVRRVLPAVAIHSSLGRRVVQTSALVTGVGHEWGALLIRQKRRREAVQCRRAGVLVHERRSMRVGKTTGTRSAERIVEGKVNESSVSLMIVVVIMGGVVDLHLLALELALDSLSIGCITNKR